MKKQNYLKLISIVFLGCFMSYQAIAAEKIKIGINVPLTGFAASDGESALNGAKLAIEQVNAGGGVKGQEVELVVYDDQASPKQAVPIANKLIEKDQVVVAVSGSYSAPTRAAAGIFQSAQVPYISAFAIHPDITRAGNYVFRTTFMGEVQGRAGAKLIGQDMNKKRVVLITLNNDFGVSLANGFKEKADSYGINIVNEYRYSIKDRRFGSIVAKVKSDKPDAIYATGYYFTAGPLISQLKNAGVKVPIIGQEGYDGQYFINIAGKASEGVIITTSLDRDSKIMETKSFIQQYEAKYQRKVDMVAASAHTAVKVAIAAISKAGTKNKAAIRDAISKTHLIASTGLISFNGLGEVVKDVQVQIVKNGEWRHYSVISDPVLLAPPQK